MINIENYRIQWTKNGGTGIWTSTWTFSVSFNPYVFAGTHNSWSDYHYTFGATSYTSSSAKLESVARGGLYMICIGKA